MISRKLALYFLNELVDLHNDLLADHERQVFFKLGVLIESLAEIVRSENKP